MANELLTAEQMAQKILDIIHEHSGGDQDVAKAIWYDLQTMLGRFPTSHNSGGEEAGSEGEDPNAST